MTFEAVIGLEIHAQLSTASKLFCRASTQGGAPNTQVSPVSLGLPGALPVLNKEAVRLAIMAGLAVKGRIQERSVFARKNYFYPDLPKGYQISQFEYPICLGGEIVLPVSQKTIRITRIHMEEDAGKLNHIGADGIAGATGSVVDLNRAGVPLIEVVSEPDIRTPQEAREYMERVHELFVFIGVCDGDLDKGSFRCDANVSIRPIGETAFGTRTEVKNLNSFRSVERAITYEIKRQIQVVQSGDVVRQYTMNYDDATGQTTPLRSKENAHDYRYFPDPDLKPLVVTSDQIAAIAQKMGELPDDMALRYQRDLALPEHDIMVYRQSPALYRFFEKARSFLQVATPGDMSKWVVGELSALMKEQSVDLNDKLATELARLIDVCKEGTISTQMIKDILPQIINGKTVAQALESGGGQISNQDDLMTVVAAVMADNPDVVAKIKNGKVASANFLMGQVMKQTQGRAKPDTVRDLILHACQNV